MKRELAKVIPCLVVPAILLVGCGRWPPKLDAPNIPVSRSAIIGTWETTDNNGNQWTLIFEPDGSWKLDVDQTKVGVWESGGTWQVVDQKLELELSKLRNDDSVDGFLNLGHLEMNDHQMVLSVTIFFGSPDFVKLTKVD